MQPKTMTAFNAIQPNDGLEVTQSEKFLDNQELEEWVKTIGAETAKHQKEMGKAMSEEWAKKTKKLDELHTQLDEEENDNERKEIYLKHFTEMVGPLIKNTKTSLEEHETSRRKLPWLEEELSSYLKNFNYRKTYTKKYVSAGQARERILASEQKIKKLKDEIQEAKDIMAFEKDRIKIFYGQVREYRKLLKERGQEINLSKEQKDDLEDKLHVLQLRIEEGDMIR